MRLLGKTSCTTAEHMARSTTGKLPSLHSPGLGDRSGWSFGAQRRRHIVRIVC